MKSSWPIILIVVAAAAGLFFFMRSPAIDDGAAENRTSTGARESGGRINDAGRDGLQAGGARPGGGGAERAGGGSGGAGGSSGRADKRQAADTVTGGTRQGGGLAGAGRPGEQRGGIADKRVLSNLPSRQLDPSRSHDDMPLAGGPDEEQVVDKEDLEPEEVPEVVFDGGDRDFDTASQVQISDAGQLAGEQGTIAFWVEPGWEPQNQDDATFIELGDSALQIEKDGETLRFQFVDGTGQQYGGTVDISAWQSGDYRHVVGTWTGNMLALYVDGAQVFYNGTPTYPALHGDTPIYVGSSLAGGAAAAPATLSQLNVRNRSLSGDEIRQLYEAGSTPPD